MEEVDFSFNAEEQLHNIVSLDYSIQGKQVHHSDMVIDSR